MTSPIRLKAMREAIIEGNVKKVELLLRAGVPADGESDCDTPFIEHAASTGQTEVFKLLCREGADLGTKGLLSTAVDGDGGRRSPALDIVMTILDEVEVPTDELDAALRFACVGGAQQVIEALVERGADVNGRDDDLSSFPLLNAVANDHVDLVEYLLNKGADPLRHHVQELDDEGTPVVIGSLLEFARTRADERIVALLEAAT